MEQDRINQELIPRVIRQHELLTGHIADHEEQDRQHLASLAALQGQTLKVRNLTIRVSAGAAVISIAAIVVAILSYFGGTA